jgi:lipopolysaccharide/colanic/teichoic acid biosynthesis glycosyltransferase
MSLSGAQEGSVPPSELLFANIRFVDVADLYEELFGRIPEEILDEAWVLRSLSENKKNFYEFFKRLVDIILASTGAVLSLPLYPFVAILIKLEDRGPIFIKQIRVGRGDDLIVIWKFRTMHTSDDGEWLNKGGDKRVTKIGKFLRKSRIDELPQLWNVLGGSLSLIGPRPELPRLVSLYEKEIPYYRLRHLVVPGLSGWAQIHHESPPHSILETREKLTYDLYYIKHRSLFLDAAIILQTIRILLSRTGL